MKAQFWIIVSLFVTSSPASAGPIPAFREVSPIVFSGGRLSRAGFQELQRLGVKTVINLQDRRSFRREKKLAQKLGMEAVFFDLPTGLTQPAPRRLEELAEFLKDESRYPVFIHCDNGEDRTGVGVGLYRVFVEGLAADTAYQEMLNYGFHPVAQAGLKCAFWRFTGLDVPVYCDLLATAP